MNKTRSLELLVGLFVVLGFVAALFMALQAANLGSFSWNQKTYTVSANFDNVGGLKPRAAIKSAGVVVGRVKTITFDPQTFQAHVVMEMDAKYPFPADSSVKILTAGLLGEQYVGIQAGADEQNLQDGSVIERTQSAVILENLISQFLYSQAQKGGS